MEWDYPVFKVDEFFDNQLSIFKEAVPKIDPRYFGLNARFCSLGQISSPMLVDYIGIYEEGDGWVLTIVKVIINNSTQYLFLPFTADMSRLESPPNNTQVQTFGKAAFGFETNSPMYGKRQWQVFDAFADDQFYQKLTDLFFPWNGSDDPVNAYTTIYESGIGKFTFRTKPEQNISVFQNGKYEFTETYFVIKWDNFQLCLYQAMPTLIDIETLETSSDIVG